MAGAAEGPGPGGRPEQEDDRKPPAAVCVAKHPLLEDVHCQRLRGHPGRHAADVESASVEMYVEWHPDDQARAG